MPLNPKGRTYAQFVRGTLFQTLAFCFCVLFGVALIADTQTANDGGWILYAVLLRSGQHLYSTQHLALQPLFVLETEFFLVLLGKSWLATKVLAVLHVVVYCVGLLILLRRSSLSDGARAIILGCAFILTAWSPLIRFDDYHVLSDCFVLYSLILLLALGRVQTAQRILSLAVALGVLSGLAIENRVNDGAALFAAVAAAILCLAPSKRVRSLLLFCFTAALTAVFIVSLTGDSLRDYASSSIFHAAASKGGTNHILAYPLHLPVNSYRWLKHDFCRQTTGYALLVALAWTFLLLPFLRTPTRRRWWMPCLGLILILAPLHAMLPLFTDSEFTLTMTALGVFAAYALGFLACLHLLRWMAAPGGAYAWDRRQILYLIPLSSYIAMASSSSGSNTDTSSPFAQLILVFVVVSPFLISMDRVRQVVLVFAAMLIVSATYYKIELPYLWHSYRALPLFTGRQWFRHPDYGPMIIEKDELKFIQPVCDQIRAGGPDTQLLSMPYSYANYFCDIPPWHGYVQTFFDTSTSQTIYGLMDELQNTPPKWIFYERQLDSLRVHEQVYNHGQPLPHRYLDQLIEQKIADGDWQVVYTSDYGTSPSWDSQWMLIQTH